METCNHDWEIISRQGLPDEYDRLSTALKSQVIKGIGRIPEFKIHQGLIKKICLKCGERVNTIEEARKILEQTVKRFEDRQELAHQMWNAE